MAKINFSETLTLASDKVSRNIYLQSISQGCMSMLPVVIIGSFASLFSGLPVNFWQNFIQSTGISGILARPVLRIGLQFAILVAAFTPHQHALRTGRSLWDTSLWPDHLYGVGLLFYLAEIVFLVKLLWIDLRVY